MIYLILKILGFLLLALVVGFLLGAGLYRARYRQAAQESLSGGEASRAEIEQLTEALSTARLALRGESKDRERAQARVAELESAVSSADRRIETAISRAQALEESLDKERQVLTEADAALRELREEHQKSLHQLEEAVAERSQIAGQIDTRQTEVEVLTRDRDTWQSDAQAALRRVKELENELYAANARAEGAEEDRRVLHVQLESVERRTEEMVLRSNAQTQTIAEREARIHDLERQLSLAPEDLGELPALNEAGFFASRPREIDDLKLISGVGPKLERLLNGLGIYQYQQIALMTSGQVAWVNEQLSFKGRIERDNWIKQAALLSGITTSTNREQSA